MRIFLIISLIALFCKTEHLGKNIEQKQTNQKIEIFGSEVKSLPITINFQIDKMKVKSWLTKNYFVDKSIKVDLVSKFKNCNIYKVKIAGSLANNVPTEYTFISILDKGISFLLPIEYNNFIEIDGKNMFGGVYNYREFDYYFIYRLEGTSLKLILDTRDINKKKVVIGYYRNDECKEYLPNRLICNYDGKKTISFNGVIKEFCKPGFDRNPNTIKALAKKTVSIELNYKNNRWIFDEKSKYDFW
ncbi:MAG: hypothetical protein V4456_16770 [Bacteroidota bacterium]